MISKIVNFLKNFYKKEDNSVDKNKFENFKTVESKGKIYAVDGGSGIIFDGGSWLISKIKIGQTCYENSKRVSEEIDEYFLIVTNSKNGLKVKTFPEVSLKLEKKRIDELQNEAREKLEIKKIEEISKNASKDDIILGDGYFEEAKVNNNVVFICKTSRLKTKTGRSLIGCINELSEKILKNKKWFYPISENQFVVKFHGKSKFCYKVNIKNPKNINYLFGSIAHYSRDPEIIGYPYPLLRIDKKVRLREDEKKAENNRIKSLARKAGINLENDEKATSMHDLLDKRAYR